MKKTLGVLALSAIFLFIACGLGNEVPAEAAYSIGFQNSHIKIQSPQQSNISCSGTISITGTSDLDAVWFCTRSPGKDLATFKADVQDGQFSIDLNLRFGPGEYTVWAGSNATSFDGTIRFLVINASSEDNRYTSPSNYVDSNDEAIIALVNSLGLPAMDDEAKVQAIHNWITDNISYDTQAYFDNRIELNSASQTLEQRKGLCRDYSFLFAAMSRSCGLPCKIVYGNATDDFSSTTSLHAWNEVLINGQWIAVDSTWDAGFIRGSSFVRSPSSKYLAPDRATFALSHQPTMVAVH